MRECSAAIRAELVHDLRGLGLCEGDGVFVHASFKSLAAKHSGPRDIIEALLDAVGSNGLVAMPGFSSDAALPTDFSQLDLSQQAAIFDKASPYNAKRSPTSGMGVIAEMFRTWPGAVRSSHPTLSVCAVGPDAGRFLAEHQLDFATGPGTPLGTFAKRPAMKILLIGVGWNRCSALHTAETLAKWRRIKQHVFKFGSGWYEARDVADDNGRVFPRVGAAFEATDHVYTGVVGNAPAKLCSYAGLISFATQYITALNAQERPDDLEPEWHAGCGQKTWPIPR